jgi:hypothetical protein
VELLPHPQFEPLIIAVDGSGTYFVEIDTTLVADGKCSIEVTAVSQDGRSFSRRGKILVDNNPPVIEFLDPTPLEGAGFVEDLPVRVRVTDSGSLVRYVKITAGDFVWEWPLTEGESAAEVDTRAVVEGETDGTYQDLIIPTEGWSGGDIVLNVIARDGHADRDAVAERLLTFVERPGFDGGERIDLPLAEGEICVSVEGIRLGPANDGDWAVLAAIQKPTAFQMNIYQRTGARHSALLMTVMEEFCAVHKIIDMNLDGMDDILAWCGSGATRRILVLQQTAERVFVETDSLATAYTVKDLAAGDLNRDGIPDIAFVSDVEPLWTGIMLSTTDDEGDFAGYAAPSFYSGAVKPNHVAIGRFSDNESNSVVVGAKGSGLVTAYPIDESGVPSMGENSSLDPDNQFIDDVSDMVAVNFTDINADSDSLIVVDSMKAEVMGIARLRQDASRRVESVREWPIGVLATDIAAGDIDSDGVADFVILCPGSNMVDVFMGNRIGGYSDPVFEGTPLVSGSGTDVTLADMDMDGFLDIVLLYGRQQLKVIFYRKSSAGGWFDGSHQGLLAQKPLSMATGHFVKPLSGSRAAFLDAAVLYKNLDGFSEIGVYSSDEIVGMPTRHAGAVTLDVRTAVGIVAGNFNVDLSSGAFSSTTRPDDLIVTTEETFSEDKPNTARIVLFEETGHRTILGYYGGIRTANLPRNAVVGNFDAGSGSRETMDVAFMGFFQEAAFKDWILQPMLGLMDGTFSTNSSVIGELTPVSVGYFNQPTLIKAFPLRLSLKRYLAGTLSAPDIMLTNRRTHDVTIYINSGFGNFQSRELGSLDFAVGGQPVDVTAGYLRNRINKDLDDTVAEKQLPDLVTLLANFVLISYSMDMDFLQQSGEDIGFLAPVVLSVNTGVAVAVEVADMNCDGIQDIIVLDNQFSKVVIFPGLGQFRFAEPYSYPSGVGPFAMKVADVDADGSMDIVTLDSSGKTVTTLHNATQACLDQGEPK